MQLVGIFVEDSGNAMLTSGAVAMTARVDAGVNLVLSTAEGRLTLVAVAAVATGVAAAKLLGRNPGVSTLVGVASGKS